MARSMTLAAETAVAQSQVACAILVSLAFPSGAVRFCSAGVSLEWDGDTYLGAGAVSGLEPIAESVTPTALSLNVRFSGIDPTYLDAILDDNYQGQPAYVLLALFDPDDLTIIADPVLVGQYRMDEPLVTLGRTATIQLSLENRMADWDRLRLRRYNHADQVARNPGDMAFEYVEELQDKVIVWGAFKGPVAPDPLKIFNRTLDRALSNPLGKLVLAPAAVGPCVAVAHGAQGGRQHRQGLRVVTDAGLR